MFILFALQLALSIWIFVQNDSFLSKMNNLVETAWGQNDSSNGYPMDALQLSVSNYINNGEIDTHTALSQCSSSVAAKTDLRIIMETFPPPAVVMLIAPEPASQPFIAHVLPVAKSSTISGPPTRISFAGAV